MRAVIQNTEVSSAFTDVGTCRALLQAVLRSRILDGYPTEHPTDTDIGQALEAIRWPANPAGLVAKFGGQKKQNPTDISDNFMY